MIKDLKTIFMTRAQWNAWEEALLSGRYAQGEGSLCKDGRYCCLGVLEKVISGDVEDRGLPTLPWLRTHAIRFASVTHPSELLSPVVYCEYDGEYKGELAYHRVDKLNDAHWSFQDIVNVMRPHVQFTDEIENSQPAD